jgi:hypothetical protein
MKYNWVHRFFRIALTLPLLTLLSFGEQPAAWAATTQPATTQATATPEQLETLVRKGVTDIETVARQPVAKDATDAAKNDIRRQTKIASDVLKNSLVGRTVTASVTLVDVSEMSMGRGEINYEANGNLSWKSPFILSDLDKQKLARIERERSQVRDPSGLLDKERNDYVVWAKNQVPIHTLTLVTKDRAVLSWKKGSKITLTGIVTRVDLKCTVDPGTGYLPYATVMVSIKPIPPTDSTRPATNPASAAKAE